MIGIFDSGIGGLSVFREIYRRLPLESYVYYSDSANCPYGEKTAEFVTERARFITEYLLGEGARIIVVACNTATAAAISALRQEYPVKFIGVEPAIKPAVKLTRSGVVGVLATAGTLCGQKFLSARDEWSGQAKIVTGVGSGFVELVERGCTDGKEAEAVVEAALKPLLDEGADTIVLGCTHYPFLRSTIELVSRRLAPDRDITIIDPAPAVASQLINVMQQEGLLTTPPLDGPFPADFASRHPDSPDIKLASSGNLSALTNMFTSLNLLTSPPY